MKHDVKYIEQDYHVSEAYRNVKCAEKSEINDFLKDKIFSPIVFNTAPRNELNSES